MNDQLPPQLPPKLPERNPLTQKAHNRQTLWQITIPFIAGVLVALAFAVLAAFFASSGTDSLWADISLIFLIIPLMLGAFISLVIFAGLVYGLLRLLKVLPAYARLAQDFFYQVEQRVLAGANLVVEPVIRVRSSAGGLRWLSKRLRLPVRRRNST